LGLSKTLERGDPFISDAEHRGDYKLENSFISECFNCSKPSLWVHQSLVYPQTKTGAPPNADLPVDVRADYEEDRTILAISPRGAAALLRLAIQKLCVHLGEKGKKIDDDIASLVSKGLDPLVQEALDSVRVIGNESVHPGQIDLRDSPDTAAELFDAVNYIADQTISRQKKLKALYDRLPVDKRAAIDARNLRTKGPQGA
jgi:hypothetical protein